MAKVQTLSAEFIDELAWTIEQVKRLVKGSLQDGEKDVAKAADCYVALTPTSGILGRNGKQVRAAICEIYKEVRTSSVSGAPKTLVPISAGSGKTKTLPVYNFYCEDVPGDLFVPTGLTKSGTRFVIEWSICDESSSSESSESSSDSSSDSLPSASESSVSIDSPSSDDIGTCIPIPTCTWWGRISEGGTKTWLAYSDLTMPQCRGISPFPNIGCNCLEPNRDPAYDYEIVYTPCNTV
jgi:hypothetical protein